MSNTSNDSLHGTGDAGISPPPPDIGKVKPIAPLLGRPALAWALIALFILNVLSSVDRLLFGVVQELIKVDLGLSDFELGILGGPAFAVLYTLAAFPIARLADRMNRVNILSIVFVVWSAMTVACGLAGSYFQMLLARMGVSVGEAGCTPAANSLISDYFPNRRASAIAVYTAGAPVGALLAAVGGGFLAEAFGWRFAFYLCGGIGIVFAVILRLTVREPPRKDQGTRPTAFLATLRHLLAKRSFALVIASGSLAALAINAINLYFVSFLIRSHDMSISMAGLVMGLAVGGVGTISTLFAGWAIDKTRIRFPKMRTWLPAASMVWCGGFYIMAFSTDATWLAITLLMVAALGKNIFIPAVYTISQEVASPRTRSVSAALVLAILSIVGYGLGPPLVGFLSDTFGTLAMQAQGTTAAACAAQSTPACAEAIASGLRLSLTAGAAILILAGMIFAFSGRTILMDIYRDPQEGDAPATAG